MNEGLGARGRLLLIDKLLRNNWKCTHEGKTVFDQHGGMFGPSKLQGAPSQDLDCLGLVEIEKKLVQVKHDETVP